MVLLSASTLGAPDLFKLCNQTRRAEARVLSIIPRMVAGFSDAPDAISPPIFPGPRRTLLFSNPRSRRGESLIPHPAGASTCYVAADRFRSRLAFNAYCFIPSRSPPPSRHSISWRLIWVFPRRAKWISWSSRWPPSLRCLRSRSTSSCGACTWP